MCPRGPPCVAFAAVGSFEVGNKPPLPPPPPLGLPPSLASAGNRQVRVRNWISQGHAGHVLNRFLVIDWLHSGWGRHPTQRKEAPATKDKRKWIWEGNWVNSATYGSRSHYPWIHHPPFFSLFPYYDDCFPSVSFVFITTTILQVAFQFCFLILIVICYFLILTI